MCFSHSQDIPRLIISQLRWLDYIVNPKALAQKLMEILPVTHLSLQKEIIMAIPEIIADAEQEVGEKNNHNIFVF
jgi:Fanconi anemia group D2 protein